MPTKNPRINVVLEEPRAGFLDKIINCYKRH